MTSGHGGRPDVRMLELVDRDRFRGVIRDLAPASCEPDRSIPGVVVGLVLRVQGGMTGLGLIIAKSPGNLLQPPVSPETFSVQSQGGQEGLAGFFKKLHISPAFGGARQKLLVVFFHYCF